VLTVNTHRPLFWFLGRGEVKSMDDLRARRPAIHEAHTAPGCFARIVLRKHGLDPDRDLKCVVRAPAGYQMDLQRLRDGSIDAAYVGSMLAPEEVADEEGFSVLSWVGDHFQNPTVGIALDPARRVAWRLLARAQQSERVRRIGVLQTLGSESDQVQQTYLRSSRDALAKLAGSKAANGAELTPADLRGVRIGIPRNYFWETLDGHAAKIAEAALGKLQGEGAVVVDIDLDDLANPAVAARAVLMPQGLRIDLAEFLAREYPARTMKDVIAGIASKSVRFREEDARDHPPSPDEAATARKIIDGLGVVPFTAGGIADMIGRVLAARCPAACERPPAVPRLSGSSASYDAAAPAVGSG
jgi:hypothetical protein